jgi:outer membrane protein
MPSLSTTLLNFSRSRTGPSVRVQENPTGEVDPVTGERIFAEETTRIPAIDRNAYSFSAGMGHTLYDGGAQRRAHEGARQSLAAAELGLQASRNWIVFQVKQRYYSLLKAQELVEVQGEALNLSQKRQEEAEARLEVGATTRVDVLRLQVAADNARADLINAEQQVVLARTTLNHVMGRELSAALQTVPIAETAPDVDLTIGSQPPREAMARLVTEAAEANPQIAQQQRTMMAAEMNLKSTQAAWHPTLSGSVSYSRNNDVFDRVYGGLSENYRLNAGVALSYNLFDGGLRRASVRRARSSVESARLSLEQQERDLALSVETTYLELVRLARILEIARRTSELAAEDLRLAEERYRVGKGRLLEVLDAQVGFTQARNNQVRTRYDLAVAQADLELLLGAP